MNDTAERLTDLERSVLFAMAEEDSEREILLRQIDTASVLNRGLEIDNHATHRLLHRYWFAMADSVVGFYPLP
jgi:hypothetical protein